VGGGQALLVSNHLESPALDIVDKKFGGPTEPGVQRGIQIITGCGKDDFHCLPRSILSIVGSLDLARLFQKQLGDLRHVVFLPKRQSLVGIHVFLRNGMGSDDHRQAIYGLDEGL